MLNDTTAPNAKHSTKTKIMIVEDDTLIMDMVARKLTESGFKPS